jgi:hypothetical protein
MWRARHERSHRSADACHVTSRVDELAARRRELLLEGQRLRAELAADQEVMLEALSGVTRTVGHVRRLASPVLMFGGGALLLRLLFFRRRGPRLAAAGVGAAGLAGYALRGLKWITLIRRAITVLTIARAAFRARQRHQQA